MSRHLGCRSGDRAISSPARGSNDGQTKLARRRRTRIDRRHLYSKSRGRRATQHRRSNAHDLARTALEAYEESGERYLDCGDFVVLAAFTLERRVITFEDRELRLVSFTGELFRLDTGLTVTYAGSARRTATFGHTGEVETITVTGLAQYLIDLEGNRIVFDAGFREVDFSSFPPALIEHGIHRDIEVVCRALA